MSEKEEIKNKVSDEEEDSEIPKFNNLETQIENILNRKLQHLSLLEKQIKSDEKFLVNSERKLGRLKDLLNRCLTEILEIQENMKEEAKSKKEKKKANESKRDIKGRGKVKSRVNEVKGSKMKLKGPTQVKASARGLKKKEGSKVAGIKENSEVKDKNPKKRVTLHSKKIEKKASAIRKKSLDTKRKTRKEKSQKRIPSKKGGNIMKKNVRVPGKNIKKGKSIDKKHRAKFGSKKEVSLRNNSEKKKKSKETKGSDKKADKEKKEKKKEEKKVEEPKAEIDNKSKEEKKEEKPDEKLVKKADERPEETKSIEKKDEENNEANEKTENTPELEKEEEQEQEEIKVEEDTEPILTSLKIELISALFPFCKSSKNEKILSVVPELKELISTLTIEQEESKGELEALKTEDESLYSEAQKIKDDNFKKSEGLKQYFKLINDEAVQEFREIESPGELKLDPILMIFGAFTLQSPTWQEQPTSVFYDKISGLLEEYTDAYEDIEIRNLPETELRAIEDFISENQSAFDDWKASKEKSELIYFLGLAVAEMMKEVGLGKYVKDVDLEQEPESQRRTQMRRVNWLEKKLFKLPEWIDKLENS